MEGRFPAALCQMISGMNCKTTMCPVSVEMLHIQKRESRMKPSRSKSPFVESDTVWMVARVGTAPADGAGIADIGPVAVRWLSCDRGKLCVAPGSVSISEREE